VRVQKRAILPDIQGSGAAADPGQLRLMAISRAPLPPALLSAGKKPAKSCY
jgi:hypothetical protein